MRSWLNGYGASFNAAGSDSSSNFIGFAFSSLEKATINSERIRAGINGIFTENKVFLLDDTEVISPSYGFCQSDVADEARRSQSSIAFDK